MQSIGSGGGIEQTIADLKTYRIMYTGYRGPFERFATTIRESWDPSSPGWPGSRPQVSNQACASIHQRGELQIGEGTLGNWVNVYRRDHPGEEPGLDVGDQPSDA